MQLRDMKCEALWQSDAVESTGIDRRDTTPPNVIQAWYQSGSGYAVGSSKSQSGPATTPT